MKIELNLRNISALENLFHSVKCGIKIRDTGLEAYHPFVHLHGDGPMVNKRDQVAIIYSVLEVTPEYHVCAVWLPKCEVFDSEFAIIHVEKGRHGKPVKDGVHGKIIKAEIAPSGVNLHRIIIDDPDCPHAILSLGYDLFVKEQRPVATWFVTANASSVHHRNAHAIQGMKGEYHLSSF